MFTMTVHTQVAPLWIYRIDQRYFLTSQPPFNLLFALNRRSNIVSRFIVNEPRDVIFGGEARNKFLLMFINSSLEIISDTCIKSAGLICHDVNVVLLHCIKLLSVCLKRQLEQK